MCSFKRSVAIREGVLFFTATKIALKEVDNSEGV